MSATANAAFLQREGIANVLSVGKSPAARIENVIYERLSLTDEEDSDITTVMNKACDIIDGIASAQGKGKVLVHC
ncbi:hypothetical protein B0H63DRAFT_464247 [Podospora didyma]|uniref:Uncharacterized protein n=1 Tax=Podospora didyma TaxID=330526 RepID=A0AAE0U3Y8_9PEZI|nr:hypothetical protein B0H63DRAFT_464247 [Podospora didyma]